MRREGDYMGGWVGERERIGGKGGWDRANWCFFSNVIILYKQKE